MSLETCVWDSFFPFFQGQAPRSKGRFLCTNSWQRVLQRFPLFLDSLDEQNFVQVGNASGDGRFAFPTMPDTRAIHAVTRFSTCACSMRQFGSQARSVSFAESFQINVAVLVNERPVALRHLRRTVLEEFQEQLHSTGRIPC